jgi:two-component system OmpR family response regulator
MNHLPEPASGHILVADDDEDIRTLIIDQLRREPYQVRAAGDIAGIKSALAEAPADLIVLDLNLPDGDGLSLCRELRAGGHDGAIIIVTARNDAIDRVLGLELGADDYLTKPFEPRELLARVRNLMRRLRIGDGRPRNVRLAHVGPWRVDLIQRRLIGPDERLVMLSSSEYRLLMRFLAAPNRVLSREALLPERSATVAFDRSIDLQVSRLRQKLASEPGGESLILTVRNEGYLLAAGVRYQ